MRTIRVKNAKNAAAAKLIKWTKKKRIWYIKPVAEYVGIPYIKPVAGEIDVYQVKMNTEIAFVPTANIPTNRHRLANFAARIIRMLMGNETKLE